MCLIKILNAHNIFNPSCIMSTMSTLIEYLRANSQIAAALEDPTLEDLLSLAPAPLETCVCLLNKFRLFTQERPKYSNCLIDGTLPYDSLIGMSKADLETLGQLVDYLILPLATRL